MKWLAALLLGALLVQTGWPLTAELAAIRIYQRVGSPVMSLAVKCRFQPTCSHYALQALQGHGFVWGNLMIAGRLLHCSPFGALADWVLSEDISGRPQAHSLHFQLPTSNFLTTPVPVAPPVPARRLPRRFEEGAPRVRSGHRGRPAI